MTPSQKFKEGMRELIQEVMEEHDLWKTCLNCKFFNEAQELCARCVPPARPPARVITFGCEAFEEIDRVRVVQPKPKPVFDDLGDDIPF